MPRSPARGYKAHDAASGHRVRGAPELRLAAFCRYTGAAQGIAGTTPIPKATAAWRGGGPARAQNCPKGSGLCLRSRALGSERQKQLYFGFQLTGGWQKAARKGSSSPITCPCPGGKAVSPTPSSSQWPKENKKWKEETGGTSKAPCVSGTPVPVKALGSAAQGGIPPPAPGPVSVTYKQWEEITQTVATRASLGELYRRTGILKWRLQSRDALAQRCARSPLVSSS